MEACEAVDDAFSADPDAERTSDQWSTGSVKKYYRSTENR